MSPFSSAADTAIQDSPLKAGATLYLKTGFAGSSTYEREPMAGWRLRLGSGRFSCGLVNTSLAKNDERSQTNRRQLFATALLVAELGSESQGLFYGHVDGLGFDGFRARLDALDRRAALETTEAFVNRSPDSVEVVNTSSTRALALTNSGVHGQVYGFTPNGSGTDPAFDEATQLVRRSIVPTSAGLFYDSGGTDPVPRRVYEWNWTSGTVTILEDTSGKSYYAQGIRAYKESAATGAANCDFARVVEDALEYAMASGGIGAAAGELDIEDTGFDLAGTLKWPPTDRDKATTAQLLDQLLPRISSNLRLIYDSGPASLSGDTGKFKLRAVTQKASGSEDLRLYRGRLSFNRNTDGLYSRVVVTGEVARPLNVLANPDAYGLTISRTDHRSDSDWAFFNGVDTHSDTTFANAVARAFDGDHQKGFIIHNIPGAGMDEWHQAWTEDFGEPVRFDLIRWRFPGTKCQNPLARQVHNGVFFPGVHLEGSLDNSTWYPVSPVFDHARRSAGTLLEARDAQLTFPEFRYLRVTLGTFKFGKENFDDPGMGCGEIELVADLYYRIVREAQDSDASGVYRYTNNQAYAITNVNTGTDTLRIAGNHLAEFSEGECIVVEGSTGNNGTWIIESVALNGGNTEITVTGNITNSTADGRLRLAVSSYHQDLLTRLGDEQRTYHRDLSGQFNEHLAQDVATQEFAERVRLFEKVEWEGPFDPRVQLWQTAVATCRVSGKSVSFLIEDAEHGQDPPRVDGQGKAKPGRLWTKVYGTNYREVPLAN